MSDEKVHGIAAHWRGVSWSGGRLCPADPGGGGEGGGGRGGGYPHARPAKDNDTHGRQAEAAVR
ncbi:MAG TPA: hypothetical protein EYP55_02300 [Anaerolineae bacterium]|nr:hypothetical protein [Anaerolineae bacterium]